MPILKARPYKGRQAFNQAWALMTREVHLEMLAKPNPRKLLPWPDPNYFQKVPKEISPATLNYNTSKRLKILSRVQREKYTPKYKPGPPLDHYVEPYTLNFVPQPRLLELAKPKPTFPTQAPKDKDKTKDKRPSKKEAKRKSKWKTFEKERPNWLALRAAPKKIRPPPDPPKPKRRTTPLSREERGARIVQLAIPPMRYLAPRDVWNPFEVPLRARRAVCTKRTGELAAHRELPEEAQLDLAFKPFTIKTSALKYKATKRIRELAEPVLKRTAANNDIKEDAFTVPKRALKAMCSKRTKELAKPIVRRGW